MAEKKLGRATKTTLAFGLVAAPINLYKTTGKDPDLPDFETAGPNGGALRMEMVPVEARPEETPVTDPLAIETAAERADEAVEGLRSAIQTTVPAVPTSKLIEEGTGEVVERDQIRKGLRIDGEFVDLTDQLAAITERTKLDEMRVVSFIRVEQVPRERIVGSYWMGPGQAAAARALRLLWEVMKAESRVAVVKWTKRTRQSLGVVVPHRSGAIQVLEVSWAEAYLPPDPKVLSIQQADVNVEELKAAQALVRAMADSRASLDEQEDEAVALRRELVEKTLGGARPEPVPERPAASPAVDLAAALRASTQRARELV